MQAPGCLDVDTQVDSRNRVRAKTFVGETFPRVPIIFFETFVEMRVPQNSNNHQSIAHDVGPT